MKVGDYVRTEKGIAKIIDKLDKMRVSYPEAWVTDTYLGIYDDTEYIYDEAIIKSSPNIIDLIEIGDIVNYGLFGGGMVIFKKDGEITTNTILFSNLKEKDIKKIITKEQIENMEYEVK